MFNLGDRVHVLDNPADETFDAAYVGRSGVVELIGADDFGASFNDPYYMVNFGNHDAEMFWTEELEKEEWHEQQ